MKRWIPEDEVQFAAKFGFLSKDLWLAHFNRGKRSSMYAKWKRLTDFGYFKFHPSIRDRRILVLNRSNPIVFRMLKGAPVRPPPVAQMYHDELLAEGALRLMKAGIAHEYSTEVEQRLVAFDWLEPRQIKLPDLLFILGKSRVALELELNQKTKDRYDSLVRAYLRRSDLDYVIFVVQTRGILNALAKAFGKADPKFKVGFMNLESWKKSPESGEIALSDSETSLSRIYLGNTDQVLGNRPG